jgi:type IV pilus assembly protein PilP
MAKSTITASLMVCLSIVLIGCDSNSDHSELHEYLRKVKARPPGIIEPIPTFRPYEAFIYSAAAKRSPFDRPVEEKQKLVTQASSDVKPDLSREKEYLESFDLNALTMVGTLERQGTLWALIGDPSGGIHRVKPGNYLGKNFGRIVRTSRTQLEIVEIVSNGLGGWVERPRVLNLSEKE